MEPVWKKLYKLIQHPPPPSGFSWAFDPPTPLEIPIPSVGGGYGYFLEPHNYITQTLGTSPSKYCSLE